MMKPTLLLAILLSLSTPAAALTCIFSGDQMLQGQFVIDDATPFTIRGPDPVFGVFAEIPVASISGSFGAVTFAGTGKLQISDLPIGVYALAEDYWIVRGTITGPSLGGLTPTLLNLFIYRHSNATTPISVTPPIPDFPTQYNFQYAIGFSDGSILGAPLRSLVAVPEPTPLLLLLMALVMGAGVRRIMRHA